MKVLFKTYIKKVILLGMDMFFVLVTLPLALFMRLDLDAFESYFLTLTPKHVAVVFLSYLAAFFAFRTYRAIVRLANFYTALRVGVACLAGSTLAYLLSVYLFAVVPPLPRSTYLIQLLLVVPLTIVPRFTFRILERFAPKPGNGVPTLVYGAGMATDRFLPVMLRMRSEMLIKGIIDDNPAKRGSEVQGVKVLGSSKDLPRLIGKYKIEQILLSMPSLPGEELRAIVNQLYTYNLRVKVLPAAEAFVKSADSLSVTDIRDLNIEDLLRRAPRSIDKTAISNILKGRTVLVTGGGGSIGSELVRQIAAMAPTKLIVNDASEFALYNITEEIRLKFPQLCFVSHLGNMANAEVARNLFSAHSINAVFHACAYKHVPLVEENVCAAIANNVQSARNVFELANRHGCERVVLISSDKAVRPTNVMGATKRICELLALWYASQQITPQKCAFSAVRFGNVLGSSGSVVPKFIEQIRLGGPVTITHPEITRFFMLIPEAVSLVLQAATASSSGEIFVLNMGQPIKIVDMAKDLVRLMGKRPDIDIEISFTGLRPGEKLYEELQLETENIESVTEDFFKLVRVAEPTDSFETRVNELLKASSEGSSVPAKELLFELVRSYETNGSATVELEPASRIQSVQSPLSHQRGHS